MASVEKESRPEVLPALPLKGKRIMVIGSNQEAIASCRRALVQTGAKFDSAEDEQTALGTLKTLLTSLKEELPQVIVLSNPENVPDFTHKLKTDPQLERIAVILWRETELLADIIRATLSDSI